MRLPLFLSISLLVAGCGEQERLGAPLGSTRTATTKTTEALTGATPPSDPPRSNRTAYQQITGGGVDAIPLSLCELLKFFTAGAGAYRVKSITGYTEELELPGNFDGFTYVELELVADWSGASPPNPVVRITGGPATADIRRGWMISLKVGEVVGLLVVPAIPENRGFLGIDPLGLFGEQPGGGYSNGQLFTKQPAALDTIGHTIQNLVPLGAGCARMNVLPDWDGPAPGAKTPVTPPPAAAPAAPNSPDGGVQ